MSNHPTDFCAVGLQALKDSYAELFLLLDQSVQEDPLAAETGGLDRLIDRLLAAIDRQMKDFRRQVEETRRSHGLTQSFQASLAEFEEQLGMGLAIMLERMSQRSTELAGARERMKEQFALLRRKQRGAKGYRNPHPASLIIESKA